MVWNFLLKPVNVENQLIGFSGISNFRNLHPTFSDDVSVTQTVGTTGFMAGAACPAPGIHPRLGRKGCPSPLIWQVSMN
jgi:hypothetical protein